MRSGLRVAWLGPQPSELGGVANVGAILLEGMVAQGAEVDCYFAGDARQLPERLRDRPGFRAVDEPVNWSWDRWYARLRALGVVTGLRARQRSQEALIQRLLVEHERQPYDVFYQFSQIELFGARRLRHRLPPIVVHPEVHAAGELHWLRREAALAARCRPWPDRVWQMMLMRVRSNMQRRDIQSASVVVAISRQFAGHLVNDYGVDPDVIRHLPNPVDLARFRGSRRRSQGGPVRVLFVSRIAVRKGVDLVVALSRRLRDLSGRVELIVVGGPSPWSDYRCLLEDLEPTVARFEGEAHPTDMPQWLTKADALIQPSRYEPFALTVGEALAAGLPVVVSDAVGAGEQVDGRCCRRFPVGDIDEMERVVRDLVLEIENGAADELATRARAEAARYFDPTALAKRLLGYLEEAAVAGRVTRGSL